MSDIQEKIIADIINSAGLFADSEVKAARKPRLLIDNANPDLNVFALVKLFSECGELFDRGVPVRLAEDVVSGGMAAHPLTSDSLVMFAHTLCRPYIVRVGKDGSAEAKDARLPRQIASMYNDWIGGWQLPPLRGIAATPLLASDGSICSVSGYHAGTGIWLDNPPDLTGLVPRHPTLQEALHSLQQIREFFSTFCFADAILRQVDDHPGLVVDTATPPRADESAFLAALRTAVCRPSIDLAPGVLIKAAAMSGAGTGKGLLARAIGYIAFGREPFAITTGGSQKELEKRIVAELLTGNSMLYIDNVNNTALKSDLLASVLTERPTRTRILQKSEVRSLSTNTLVVLTGNGLSMAEDLARRFVTTELDSKSENPEARVFLKDFRVELRSRRLELLGHLLTIWRWGRLHPSLPAGRPLGSFEQWGDWVRDPLLALGCLDPAERVAEAKSRDPGRQHTADIFAAWRRCHAAQPVSAHDLHDDVKLVIDPQKRGRQYLAAHLEKLVGTRMHGHVLTRQASVEKWGHATFAVIDAVDGLGT